MSKLVQIKGRVVSIEKSKKKLTKGEMALLSLMMKKLENNEIITRKEIEKIWLENVNTNTGGMWFGDNEKNRSVYWLKYAIGNLVLKQKLAAIPLIEIE